MGFCVFQEPLFRPKFIACLDRIYMIYRIALNFIFYLFLIRVFYFVSADMLTLVYLAGTLSSLAFFYVFEVRKLRSLFGGSLFFGEDVKQPASIFQSKLVLWGLINNGWAVVGDDPGSNQNTWIVKAGDAVVGEQIVTVGVRYLSRAVKGR